MDIMTWTGHNAFGLFVDSLNDLEILFNSPSLQVLDFLEHCFQRTPYCDQVENVEWRLEVEAFVFYLDKSNITEAKTKDVINEMMLKSVEDKDK